MNNKLISALLPGVNLPSLICRSQVQDRVVNFFFTFNNDYFWHSSYENQQPGHTANGVVKKSFGVMCPLPAATPPCTKPVFSN